ncbi:MAG TPA: ABC transporter ATP-binding protein [Candidatus Deferrimicrobiaceae bacterium]|jgi:branched-chain amino acid transport system ATP-binding protein|nr:ABC transporter ATP-binding protein [Candidatus Deferrimicrobiaceae bacterium]
MKPPVLEVRKLSRAFGGLKVTNDVSFAIREGELSSIIGPNGAGKTTLFNLITGKLIPDSGEVLFRGERIDGLSTAEIARRGIGRAFQITSIFPERSVLDNVLVAILARRKMTGRLFRRATSCTEAVRESMEVLDMLSLAGKVNEKAGSLPHGDQKRLDIAVALSLNPELVLLDEPMAGMSPEERAGTVELVRRIWKERSLTLVFIEHDMDVVFLISEWIRVLNQGLLLAEGTPEMISRNRDVIAAYLGEEIE